jgi:hypothetical protein
MSSEKQSEVSQDRVKVKETYSVADLLKREGSENNWIIDQLLRKGDQMLLSAAPKSGKSLLAAEIAISLSRPFKEKNTPRFLFNPNEIKAPDGKPYGFKIEAPNSENLVGWKVLFFSLEMRADEIKNRLKHQLQAFGVPVDVRRNKKIPAATLKEWDFPLVHCFGVLPAAKDGEFQQIRQNLDVLPQNFLSWQQQTVPHPDDSEFIKNLIQKEQPDVVIYDTLIQLHSMNENENVAMKAVMQKIRKITCRVSDEKKGPEAIAHIILHHTRKENTAFRVALSPEMMRGAGSMHGIADVVLLARQQEYGSARTILEMHVSSRSSNVANFYVRRNGNLTHEWYELPAGDKLGKREINNRCFHDALLVLLKKSGRKGIRIDHAKLLDLVREKGAESGLTLKIPTGPEAVSRHVQLLIDRGKIEYAVNPKDNRGKHWDSYPLRMTMHGVKKQKA